MYKSNTHNISDVRGKAGILAKHCDHLIRFSPILKIDFPRALVFKPSHFSISEVIFTFSSGSEKLFWSFSHPQPTQWHL